MQNGMQDFNPQMWAQENYPNGGETFGNIALGGLLGAGGGAGLGALFAKLLSAKLGIPIGIGAGIGGLLGGGIGGIANASAQRNQFNQAAQALTPEQLQMMQEFDPTFTIDI